MKIISHEIYKGIFPEMKDDEVRFLSNEAMMAHPELLAEVDILNVHPYILNQSFLDMCPKVKWIQTAAAGVDSADLEAIKSRGILFTNGTGNMSISIAEDVFCKMMLFSRRVREFDEAKSKKEWITFNQDPWMAVVSNDLYGKKLGLVGDGAIAMEIGKRAKAFDMQILTYGRDNGDCRYWDEFFDTREGLEKLLCSCDYIVLVAPLNKATKHMMNADAFKIMKQEAMLINVARGGLVVEDDLVEALITGEIAAAALDVYEVEPLPVNSKLWELPNVFMTTHKAGAGDSWVKRLKDLYEENLQAFKSGKPLRNVICD